MARFGAKVAMKVLGRRKKRLQYNIVPSWHSDVLTMLKMRVVATSVSDAVTTSLYDVAKRLPQSCYKVATTPTNGCAGAF